jgi:hypothetical protein
MEGYGMVVVVVDEMRVINHPIDRWYFMRRVSETVAALLDQLADSAIHYVRNTRVFTYVKSLTVGILVVYHAKERNIYCPCEREDYTFSTRKRRLHIVQEEEYSTGVS